MSLRFMLDTDTVSYWLRGVRVVHDVFDTHPRVAMCVSAVTLAQLRYGAMRRNSAKLHGLIDKFTSQIAVLPFDEACAIEYGRIATDLAVRGTPIGELDAMIAAHAVTLNLTLVTNNVKHFSRVSGLRLENWA